MSPVGFEPTISAGEGPQTYALDRAVTETASTLLLEPEISEGCIFIVQQNLHVLQMHSFCDFHSS